MATLIIGRVTPSDSKRYVLVAKNNRGTLRYPAVVRVRVFCLSWMNSKCHLSSFPDSGSDRHDDCNRPGHRPSPPRLHSVFRAGLRLQTRKGMFQRTEAQVGERPDTLPSVRSQEVTAEHGNFDLYGKESERTLSSAVLRPTVMSFSQVDGLDPKLATNLGPPPPIYGKIGSPSHHRDIYSHRATYRQESPARREPTYPLPPQSQFPLRGQPQTLGIPTTPRKTPQNSTPHEDTRVMYADLSFPAASGAASNPARERSNNNVSALKLPSSAQGGQSRSLKRPPSPNNRSFLASSTLGTTGSYYPRPHAEL